MTEQQRQLKRVTSRIGRAVLMFFHDHGVGDEFHAHELHAYVSEIHGVAPASADRVMRQMRRDGELNYRVLNRAQSRYRICAVPVPEQAALPLEVA